MRHKLFPIETLLNSPVCKNLAGIHSHSNQPENKQPYRSIG